MTLAEMLFNRLKQEGYFLERDRKYIQALIEVSRASYDNFPEWEFDRRVAPLASAKRRAVKRRAAKS